MLKKKNKRIVIIGGGITGLSAAYISIKNGYEVVVLESTNKAGGLLSTFEIGGALLEKFYHHFFTHDKELIWLLKELGLESKVVYKRTKMGVFTEGKTYNFNGIFDLLKFKPFNFFDIILFSLTSLYLSFIADWKKLENISALDWLEKHSGKKVTRILWKPLIVGKFGPYANILPISWLIGRLSQRFKSRNSGVEMLGYLEGSLEILVSTLVSKLKTLGVKFETEFYVKEAFIEDDKILYVTNGTKNIYGDEFLFATPTNVTSSILARDERLKNKLESIKYFGAVCVVLELKKKLSDIYWINIADESSPFVGIIEQTNLMDSSKYGGSNIVYLTKYFSNNDTFYSKASDEDIINTMVAYLPKINPNFNKSEIKSNFVFRSSVAAVVCDLNFSSKVPKYKTNLDNGYIASIVHVYPDERSANNSIRVAAEVCKKMGMLTDFIPEGNSLSGKIGI